MDFLTEHKYTIAYALVIVGALAAIYFLWRKVQSGFKDVRSEPDEPDHYNDNSFTIISDEEFARRLDQIYGDDDSEDDAPHLIAGGKPPMQRTKKRWPSYKPPHKG